MQDKEFDSLFRSKLENFEAEPTGEVWLGITEQLDGKRGYRALLPWLSIAASVTILAAAGIIFIPQKKAGDVKHSDKVNIVKTQPPVIKTEPVKIQPEPKAAAVAVTQPANQLAHVKVKPINNEPEKIKEIAPPSAPAIENLAKRNEQPILAIQQKQEHVTPVLPDEATPIIDNKVIAATPTVTAANLPVADKQETAQPKPKKRVHGIGGFLNTVIAAVDKRKDKIIEFSNSDDDESSNISAVNLGILKFKNKDK